jgi:ketosteroid isomerase-like protein
MSRKPLIFAATVALSLLATLSFPPTGFAAEAATGAANAGLVAELTRQADRWDKDIVRKDAVAIAANMAEDFRQIGSDGSVADKAAFVRDITSSDLTIDPYTVEDFDVRIYGDTALLFGRTRMTGSYQGKPFATHYRYIDIYVRRAGKWQIVSVQTTRIAEPAAE